MTQPCEYCGVYLPLGVDKGTRRVRSFHFASCEKRPQTTPSLPDLKAQRDALLEAYRKMKNVAAGYSNLCDDSASTSKLEREFEAADAIARAAIAKAEEA